MPPNYKRCVEKAKRSGKVSNAYAYCSPVLKNEQRAHPGRHWVEGSGRAAGHWARNPKRRR
jgi:hypothetical protein